MSDRLPGRYPGGPSRDDEGGTGPRAPLRSVEEQLRRSDARRRVATGRHRRRRIALGFAAALVVAGVAGFLLGHQATRSTEEIARAREEAARSEGLEETLRGEADRVIQQMWLSEILEQQGGGLP